MTNFDNLNLTPEILSKLNFGVNEDTNEFFICTSEMCSRCMFKQKLTFRNMPDIEVIPLTKRISTESYNQYECTANANSRLAWLNAKTSLLSYVDKALVKTILKEYTNVISIRKSSSAVSYSLFVNTATSSELVMKFNPKSKLFINLELEKDYTIKELEL